MAPKDNGHNLENGKSERSERSGKTLRSDRSQSSYYDKSGRSDATVDEPQFRDAKRKPVFTMPLVDRTAAENSSIKLTCQIIGIDASVRWYKQNTILDGNPKYVIRFCDGLATIEIFSVRPEDSGEYTCEAKNCYGETSCSANLKVYEGYEKRAMPPIFTRSMKGRWYARFHFIVFHIIYEYIC